jgi:hypothetical protein
MIGSANPVSMSASTRNTETPLRSVVPVFNGMIRSAVPVCVDCGPIAGR